MRQNGIGMDEDLSWAWALREVAWGEGAEPDSLRQLTDVVPTWIYRGFIDAPCRMRVLGLLWILFMLGKKNHYISLESKME